MTEFSGDFEGFDAASLDAIDTEIFDSMHADLPDPIDGADASGVADGSLPDTGPEPNYTLFGEGSEPLR